MKVLITGGAGYIGSTVASALIDRGLVPVVLDNLVTGRPAFAHGRVFYRGDIEDGELIDRVFRDHPDITTVVHCAALIVAPESVAQPLAYYHNNVAKSIAMLRHLVRNDCRRVVFSSSAAIYAPAPDFQVNEDSPLGPSSPYAQTKLMIEQILMDAAASHDLRAISLRYFNPIGADPQLRTGQQIAFPTHALGKILEAWAGGRPFEVTGTDWPTRDGTGIRDYIHVWDLASAHVAAVRRFDHVLDGSPQPGYRAINLGTGMGTTVRELVAAFSSVVGAPLSTRDVGRRPGDVAGAFTTSKLSADLLDWSAQHSIEDAIRDALRWREVDRGHLAEATRPVTS